MEGETADRRRTSRRPASAELVPAILGTALLAFFSLALGASSAPLDAPDFFSSEPPHSNGVFRNYVSVEQIHADGSREPTQYAWNTVTNEGLNWTRDALSGAHACPTGVNSTCYRNWTVIELSTNAAAAAASDGSCPLPVTGNGLGIAQATTIVRGSTGNYTVSLTFSPTGTQSGIQKVCLSNNTASASSDLMASALLAVNTSVVSGDTLIVNYSVAVT